MICLPPQSKHTGISLKIESIPVEETIERVRRQLDEEESLSPALRSSLELLLVLVSLLLNRLGLNSRNSS